MIQPDSVIPRTMITPMMYPDNLKVTGLTDQELGGIAIGDSTQGLTGWLWTLSLVGSDMVLTREGSSSVVLLTGIVATDIALAFDQNMRPTVAWKDGAGELQLRYYDSLSASFTILSLGSGRSPRLSLDDKRAMSNNSSDIIFAYIRDNTASYRQQRDRFQTEYSFATVANNRQNIIRIGMGGLRMQFELGAGG